MDFPLYHGASYKILGIDAADSDGTDLTCTTLNVKGSWVSLGTIPAGVVAFDVIVHKSDGSAFLIDLAAGPAYNIVAPNVYIRRRTNHVACVFRIPIQLPAGQTLYARCQSAASAKVVSVSVLCKVAGYTCASALGIATDYGTETADTSAITVDPGGTAHTKGSWTQIVASTSRPIRQLLLMFGGAIEAGPPTPATPDRTYESWLWDIGIGAATAEKIIIPNLGVVVSALADALTEPVFGPFDVNIPAGTRISARCQASLTDAIDRLLDLSILGFD